MKIAIVGGTGKLGTGLAAQLSKKHEVYIGSRDEAKAEAAAKAAGVKGGESHAVAGLCEAAVLTIPYEAVGPLVSFERELAGKLVISPVVPMRREGGAFYYLEGQGSAAQQVASALKSSRVAAALHTLPARFLKQPEKLNVDVPVAADDKGTFAEAAEIVRSVGGLRPLYSGPLSSASSIERLTPLLLNLAALNGFKTPSVKFVD
ncbi:MAG: NAD(P)-binding domain-containing protein [Nitrososphaerales archaeon]|nr:NAD(P)-binding domain-containing protein [Nitrososphaerales archaeon]